MQKIYLVIGNKDLSFFEDANGKMEQIFIQGNETVPIWQDNRMNDGKGILSELLNEMNLSSPEELELIVLKSRDRAVNKAVLGWFEGCKVNESEMDALILVILHELEKKDGALLHNPKGGDYGVNLDGRNYRLVEGKVKEGPFHLLGYTLQAEEILSALISDAGDVGKAGGAKQAANLEQAKRSRIRENLAEVPYVSIPWDTKIQRYAKKMAQFQALLDTDEYPPIAQTVRKDMEDFLQKMQKDEFQIAIVGTVKTGKSTLINALIGHDLASVQDNPETAALTKFRGSDVDYVKVSFYSKKEWSVFWDSRGENCGAFMREYNELGGDAAKGQWIGHGTIYQECPPEELKEELHRWTSSQSVEHYFVKEVEVGISNLPGNLPKQIVFVDTPGLSDPVAYRSDITKRYIRSADAVFMCVEAQRLQQQEMEIISSVFSFSSHNKGKVYILATQWDRLNNPVEGWKLRRENMLNLLVGPGFFDTREMAESNIFHCAAIIENLCRDFDGIDSDGEIILNTFMFKMHLRDEEWGSERLLEIMREKCNIREIWRQISDRLVARYHILLAEDYEVLYQRILFDLKRWAKESHDEAAQLAEASMKDMGEMQAKVEEKQRQYDEIVEGRKEMTALLGTVEKATNARLKKVLEALDKAVEGTKA